jgi:hypothetical protein
MIWPTFCHQHNLPGSLTMIAPQAATQVVLSAYTPLAFGEPNCRMNPLFETILPAIVTCLLVGQDHSRSPRNRRWCIL